MARLSLAQQIALLDEPTPIDVDPEDALRLAPPSGADPEAEQERGEEEGRKHYVTVGKSTIRAQLGDPALDGAKFKGVKATRGSLFDDLEFSEDEEATPAVVEDDDDSEEDEDEPDLTKFRPALALNGQEDQDEEQSDEDDEDETPDAPAAPIKPARLNGLGTQEAGSSDIDDAPADLPTQANHSQPLPAAAPTPDALKGRTLSLQLSLINTLLTSRIALQKSVVNSNRLPLPAHLASCTSHPEASKSVRELQEELEGFEQQLAELREGLWRANEPGLTLPERPLKRKRPASLPEEEAEDFPAHLSAAHAYHAHLSSATHGATLQTLHKWSSKILAVHPQLLQPSGGQTSRFAQTQRGAAVGPRTVVEAIDQTLQNDGEKLLRRVRRKAEDRLGPAAPAAEGAGDVGPAQEGEAEAEEDQEAFDDSEFYGSLLREIIDHRRSLQTASNGLSSTALDQLLPNRRSKLSKKKVDTKASKGRKIRYEVHEKVRGFMVPDLKAGGGWGEAQREELFASLLGGEGLVADDEVRRKEVREAGEGEGVESMDVDVGQLRVFG